jgi:hypothetical protein
MESIQQQLRQAMRAANANNNNSSNNNSISPLSRKTSNHTAVTYASDLSTHERKKPRCLFIEPLDHDDDSSFDDSSDSLSAATWCDESSSSVGVERLDQLSLSSGLSSDDDDEAKNDETRATIDAHLLSASRSIGGLKLSLNKQGCCAFRYDGMSVVLDVPNQGGGAFCFHTPQLLPAFAKNTEKDLASLQGQTRGGLLSTRKRGGDEGAEEVIIFSYVDNVNDISASEFLHILLNFVDTAVSLRSKLLLLASTGQEQELKRNTTDSATDSLVVKTACMSIDKSTTSDETTGATATCAPCKEKTSMTCCM